MPIAGTMYSFAACECEIELKVYLVKCKLNSFHVDRNKWSKCTCDTVASKVNAVDFLSFSRQTDFFLDKL